MSKSCCDQAHLAFSLTEDEFLVDLPTRLESHSGQADMKHFTCLGIFNGLSDNSRCTCYFDRIHRNADIAFISPVKVVSTRMEML